MSIVAATLFLQATQTSIFTNLSRRARGLQPDGRIGRYSMHMQKAH